MATMLTSEESTDQTTFQMSTIPGNDPTTRAICIPVNSFSGKRIHNELNIIQFSLSTN